MASAIEVPGVCTKLVEIKPCPSLSDHYWYRSLSSSRNSVHVIEITLLESF